MNSTFDSDSRDQHLTLREAIKLANGTLSYDDLHFLEKLHVDITNGKPAANQKDTIKFNILVGPLSITPASQLPEITDQIVIDGTSQPNYQEGSPLVQIVGANAGNGANGLTIMTTISEIRGLVINDFSTGFGILIQGSQGSEGGNYISGCFIGIDWTGTVAKGNKTGIRIIDSTFNLVGTGTSWGRNIISGNRQDGIQIFDSRGSQGDGKWARGNQVIGNYIGTNKSGMGAVENTFNGINITSYKNYIGGPDGDFNVISGNRGSGIIINRGDENQILANYVGVKANGTEALPNCTGALAHDPTAGVEIQLGNATQIGTGCVISGNNGFGVFVQLGVTNTTISKSKIGKDINGNNLPNAKERIKLQGQNTGTKIIANNIGGGGERVLTWPPLPWWRSTKTLLRTPVPPGSNSTAEALLSSPETQFKTTVATALKSSTRLTPLLAAASLTLTSLPRTPATGSLSSARRPTGTASSPTPSMPTAASASTWATTA